MIPTERQIAVLREENKRWPEALKQVPHGDWPPVSVHMLERPQEVWRSRRFLVQIYPPKNGGQRLSVCTTEPTGHTWKDGITWDDLQRLKAECGRANTWAVEIYPADFNIVNVANMRHIWLIHEAPPFAWK